MTRRSLSLTSPPIESEPDLSPAYKRAIEGALRWAWGEVCREHADIVRDGTEEQITERMEWMLNRQDRGRRCAPGLRLFDAVSRGAKQRTADNRIEKAPDLTFRPPCPRTVGNRSHWGMFVECKIVDGGSSVGRYCTEGVRRYAEGEYCARMKTGLMLAYARDGQRPYPALAPRLGAYAAIGHESRQGAADASDSKHRRTSLPNPCADIALIHLWLVPTGR